MTKVLLYSGGMDSWLIDKLEKPEKKIFINFHTKSCKEEIKRLPKDVEVLDFDLSRFEIQNESKLLPLRNLILCIVGSYFGNEVILGSVAGSVHKDNDEKFRKQTQRLLNRLYSEIKKKVKISLPYKDITKTELVSMYIKNGGDIKKAYNESFSCYTPKDGKECGECPSCKQKKEAFKNNGLEI